MPRLPAIPIDVRLSVAWGRTLLAGTKDEPHDKRLERVEAILDDHEGHQKKERENSRLRNLARIDAKLRDDDRSRLEKLVREETDSAGLVEKGETAERESARTYQDYLRTKKQRGGRPLTEDEWEARYKKAAARLTADWGRPING